MTKQTLSDYLYSCIDTSEYDKAQFPTLKSIILAEKGVNGYASQELVESWLRGLPSSVNLAFSDFDIQNVLKECGCPDLGIDGYWAWAAYHIHYHAIVKGN